MKIFIKTFPSFLPLIVQPLVMHWMPTSLAPAKAILITLLEHGLQMCCRYVGYVEKCDNKKCSKKWKKGLHISNKSVIFVSFLKRRT